MRVGIEVGGTFTDLVAIRDGEMHIVKVPSTPDRPDVGALNALAAGDITLGDVEDLVHGSTVATNAVLERKGGRVGVFVTRGTKDVFALQRHDRQSIYDLHYKKPIPIVAREDICEIDERLGPDGSVVRPLDDNALQERVEEFLIGRTFDAIAVCLLHSYANPEHENRIAAAVRRCRPDLPVTCSANVSPEFREYERASTTALAAYVQPVIAAYLDRFSAALRDGGFTGRFSIMQSNGGRMPASGMQDNAITALFSGPAAGVVGATGIAARAGFDNIITLDMGGTSTDVSLVAEGTPGRASQTMIDGLPVRTPVIDIATVGAGGGSIAWVDSGGLLRVGPHSSGATPGPACYGRGGEQPTITDAHLIRGTLQPRSFLGGTMRVHRTAALAAYKTLAASLDVAVDVLADSAIRIAENNIVGAIQQVSTERGLDPRDFVLVPYGGAGPLHAARVAGELGMRTILVPENAGVLSAAGLLMSDYVHYRARTERTRLAAENLPAIQDILSELHAEACAYLVEVGITGRTRIEYVLEMRYLGQAFELPVILMATPSELSLETIFEAFRSAHHRIFEFSKPPDKAVEIVSYRVGVHVSVNTPTTSAPRLDCPPDIADPSRERMDIIENGDVLTCILTTRDGITAAAMPGPILVEDQTSTVYVPPEWTVRKDEARNLVLERHG